MSSSTLPPILPQKFGSLPQIAPQIPAPKFGRACPKFLAEFPPEIPGGLPEFSPEILPEILLAIPARNFGHPNVGIVYYGSDKFGAQSSGRISGEYSGEYSGRVFCGAAGGGISGRNFRQAPRNLGQEFGVKFRSKPPEEICRWLGGAIEITRLTYGPQE